MAYDVAVLNSQRRPVDQISFAVDEHFAIIKLAHRLSLPQLQRMSDYYEDAEYSSDDVIELVKEVETALAYVGSGVEKARIPLTSLLEISKRAMEGKVGLMAIAD